MNKQVDGYDGPAFLCVGSADFANGKSFEIWKARTTAKHYVRDVVSGTQQAVNGYVAAWGRIRYLARINKDHRTVKMTTRF